MVDCLYRISKKKGVGWQNDFQLNQKTPTKNTNSNKPKAKTEQLHYFSWLMLTGEKSPACLLYAKHIRQIVFVTFSVSWKLFWCKNQNNAIIPAPPDKCDLEANMELMKATSSNTAQQSRFIRSQIAAWRWYCIRQIRNHAAVMVDENGET